MPDSLAKLTITLETVTPLFSGGADNRTPELRSPPFRGMMRYWFRALAGGVVGDSERALDRVRQREAEVFGSPDETHGQSAVWVRLSTPDYDQDYKTRVLPHHDEIWTDHQGRTLKNYPQPAIPPGVTPILTITLKPNADIQKLEMAVWSLLVGLTLGGIGKRSRRGFGSLRLKNIEVATSDLSEDLIQHLKQAKRLATSGEDLAERVGQLLTDARNVFTAFLGDSTPQFKDPPRFSLLMRDTRIVIWEPVKSMEDHVAVLSPLMNKLSDLMRSEGKEDFAQAFGGIGPRRASPLWVSTHRLNEQSWALVLTHLKAQYQQRRAGNKHHLVTQFLNSPPTDWTKVEVTQ